jgi:hypothetical protein
MKALRSLPGFWLIARPILRKGLFSTIAALCLLLARTGQAQADVTYTLDDAGNGVSASATFSTVAGGIKIAVFNTEANTPDAGHAISQIQFTYGGGLGTITAFTEIKGTETDFSNPTTSVDAKPPTSTQHWAFQNAGSTTSLWTVDSGALNGYGGQPNHLIVALGSTPDASLTNTHLPSFIGEVDFFLADASVPSNLTAADITGVKFAFGTTPEVPLENGSFNDPPPPTPEPATLTLLGIGGLGLGWYRWTRRRRQLVSA